MGEEKTISINLIIADRPYPLKVKPSEEEGVRIAAKEINQKVKDFQQTYSAKDKQDYLAMCALMYAVENLNKQKTSTKEKQTIQEEIEKFEDLLNEYR